METRRLADQLRRSYEGKAWHGPALRELLDGVTAEQAAVKPITGAHSIWELVLHTEAWEAEALAVVNGKPFEMLEGLRDWPHVGETTPAAWQTALSALEATTRALIAAVRGMDDQKLNDSAGGREFSNYFLLHGVVQHNLYHAGQIALLKRGMAHAASGAAN